MRPALWVQPMRKARMGGFVGKHDRTKASGLRVRGGSHSPHRPAGHTASDPHRAARWPRVGPRSFLGPPRYPALQTGRRPLRRVPNGQVGYRPKRSSVFRQISNPKRHPPTSFGRGSGLERHFPNPAGTTPKRVVGFGARGLARTDGASFVFGRGPYFWNYKPFKICFRRCQPASRAFLFSRLPAGSSPARMKPCPAPP